MKTENEEKKAKDQADIFKKSGRKKAVRDNTETRIVRVPVFSETKVATAEDIGESEQIDVRLPRRATVFNKQGERIGKVRKSIWQNQEGIEQGTFVKEETNVFVYSGRIAHRLCGQKRQRIVAYQQIYSHAAQAGTLLDPCARADFGACHAAHRHTQRIFSHAVGKHGLRACHFHRVGRRTKWEDTEDLPFSSMKCLGTTRSCPA